MGANEGFGGFTTDSFERAGENKGEIFQFIGFLGSLGCEDSEDDLLEFLQKLLVIGALKPLVNTFGNDIANIANGI